MKIHRHVAHNCLSCGNTLDASICVDRKEDRGPQPGDAMICKRCGSVHILTTEGLRRATPTERAEVVINLRQQMN